MGAPGEQHDCGNGAGAGHEGNGEREGGEIARALLDRLFGGFPFCKSQSPIKAAPTRIAAAIKAARTATCRRSDAESPSVMPMKVGAKPMGSTTTSRVTSAEMRNPIMNRLGAKEQPIFRQRPILS
jgi:hypothetical protein